MIGLPDAADLPLDDETWEQACLAAEERWVDDEHLLNAQRILAQAGRWDGVYVLSVIAGLETSVLIDADDKVFIDWDGGVLPSSRPSVAVCRSNSGSTPTHALPPTGAARTRTA